VTPLQKLREAQTLKGVAKILGFKPSRLAYILYRLPDALKYTSFTIPKRNGDVRQIKAPVAPLRLLQRRLANLLYLCLEEVEKSGAGRRSLAHGFVRGRSIVTNASLHKRRRYVLNLDLENFFPSFNFGRVRGFFIKDKHFSLHEKAATIFTQIACHDNELPQGSPCSPIISNLIGHLLDVGLVRLAKVHKCTYSRYADDITFSSNRKEFPSELAAPIQGTSSQWQLGAPLIAKIEDSGFRIRHQKTRMQLRGSRQVTTGLLVNEKVNVRPEYYRSARAMCHTLFLTGAYYRVVPTSLVEDTPGDDSVIVPIAELGHLEGMLAHIHYVKKRTPAKRQDVDKKKPPSAQALYRRFLFYKNFVALRAPLIVPEGKTDSIYLCAAIKQLKIYHPLLGQVVDGTFSTTVRFMNCTRTVHEVLQLGNGSGGFNHLIHTYKRMVEGFGHAPLARPVILLIDNDDGADGVFKAVKNTGGPTISHASSDPFYHLSSNLYLIKTPEKIGIGLKSRIEDLFDPELLNTVIDGKTFDPDNEHAEDGRYGKLVFAKKVVKPNAGAIDFS
jgi:RNA-directed DNA polymerase